MMLLGDLFDSFFLKGKIQLVLFANAPLLDVCSPCLFACASQRLRATVNHKLDASLDQHSSWGCSL